MAPGPRLLVAEKGPALRKTFKINHRKTFEYTLCVLLTLAGRDAGARERRGGGQRPLPLDSGGMGATGVLHMLLIC